MTVGFETSHTGHRRSWRSGKCNLGAPAVSQGTKDLFAIAVNQSLVFNPLLELDNEIDGVTDTREFRRAALSKLRHEITRRFEVPTCRFSLSQSFFTK
jgi:hypothetical protein